MSEFIDIREIHPDYYEQECWNCGYTELRNRPYRKCPECFMGQDGTDADGDYVTEEGYIDYRKLWYGDVTIEEAKRRYEANTKSVRERLKRNRGRERSVRI